MTSTGKSGQYRYYACSARIKRGPEACSGRRIPMEQLDDLVVGAVTRHLVQPERLTALLQTWLDRSATAVAERAHERGAHDGAVGVVEDPVDLVGRRDADADAGVLDAVRAQAIDEGAGRGIQLRRLPRDAHRRDGVPEYV